MGNVHETRKHMGRTGECHGREVVLAWPRCRLSVRLLRPMSWSDVWSDVWSDIWSDVWSDVLVGLTSEVFWEPGESDAKMGSLTHARTPPQRGRAA